LPEQVPTEQLEEDEIQQKQKVQEFIAASQQVFRRQLEEAQSSGPSADSEARLLDSSSVSIGLSNSFAFPRTQPIKIDLDFPTLSGDESDMEVVLSEHSDPIAADASFDDIILDGSSQF
jgi:hypothetical protein